MTTPSFVSRGAPRSTCCHRPSSAATAALAMLTSLAGCGVDADPGAPDSESSGEAMSASRAGALSIRCPPAVPQPELAAPSGHELAFSFKAIGVQIYACSATETGSSWVFQAPDAKLFGPCGQIAGTHFAGPTWQANDGSAVVGARVAAVTVDATAIPWLLLSAASHTGAGRMAEVSFIQRLDTVGGLAPTTGCDAVQAGAGAVARVDYRAEYFFYKPTDGAAMGPRCK